MGDIHTLPQAGTSGAYTLIVLTSYLAQKPSSTSMESSFGSGKGHLFLSTLCFTLASLPSAKQTASCSNLFKEHNAYYGFFL